MEKKTVAEKYEIIRKNGYMTEACMKEYEMRRKLERKPLFRFYPLALKYGL
jgi:hypothetical protein